MKTAVLTFVLVCFVVPGVFAQSKIKQRDLRGTWKLVVDIDKEDGENMIERAALGAVDGILSGMDISFTFEKNNELKVTVYIFGEEEIEYSNWELTDDGGVYIGDNEHFQIEDTIWYMEGDRLIAREQNKKDWDEEKSKAYLQKMH